MFSLRSFHRPVLDIARFVSVTQFSIKRTLVTHHTWAFSYLTRDSKHLLLDFVLAILALEY